MRTTPKLLIVSLPFLILHVASLASSDQKIYHIYLPTVQVTSCLTYKATMWLEAPAIVRTGQEFEVTAFLRSDDCSSFGMPSYSLHSEPGIWDSPFPYQGANVGAGETGNHTFTLTAPDEPQTVRVGVGAFFEVFYPPSGPWSWGSSGTPWYTITIEEPQ